MESHARKCVPVLALLLSSCGSALQPDLFAVDFVNARYPVMLSRASSCVARPIAGKSGIYSERFDNFEATKWNMMGASAQVASQVGATDKCVQIERVIFSARHEGVGVGQKSELELRIHASVSP